MSRLLEDHATRPVPVGERKSFVNLMVTTSAWVLSMSSMWTGSLLAQGLAMPQALLAILLGMLLLCAYGLLQGWLGAYYGVSTSVLAREAFGRLGASLFGGLLALVLGIGWFGWQLAFFAQTLQALFPDAWLARAPVASVWAGLLMVFTALLGYRALAGLSFVALPLKFGLVLWGLALAIGQGGASARLAGQGLDLPQGITLVVGNAAIGAAIFPDLTRYARSPWQGGLATASGYFIGGVVSLLAGATLAAVGGSAAGNLPAAMLAAGMGGAAFLVLLFAQWTTNAGNLYSGTLGLSNLLRLPPPLLCLGMGALGIAIAVAGAENLFVPFLTLLGSHVPPIAGVMLVDHWLGKRRLQRRDYRFGADAQYPQLDMLAIAAVLVSGFLASRLGVGIVALNAIVLGAALHGLGLLLAHRLRLPTTIGAWRARPQRR